MDPAKANSRCVYKHDGTYYAVALDRKQQRLFAGSSDYAIHVFDLPKDTSAPPEPSLKKQPQSQSAKSQPAKTDEKAPAPKFEPVARWTKHDNYVSALTFVERTGTLVSGSYDGQLVWWDVGHAPRLPADGHAGRVSHAAAGHAGWVRALMTTPDGTLVISAGDDMLVKLWDAGTGKLVRALE